MIELNTKCKVVNFVSCIGNNKTENERKEHETCDKKEKRKIIKGKGI